METFIAVVRSVRGGDIYMTAHAFSDSDGAMAFVRMEMDAWREAHGEDCDGWEYGERYVMDHPEIGYRSDDGDEFVVAVFGRVVDEFSI